MDHRVRIDRHGGHDVQDVCGAQEARRREGVVFATHRLLSGLAIERSNSSCFKKGFHESRGAGASMTATELRVE